MIKKLTLRTYFLMIGIILGGIALDQLTKLLAVRYLMPVDTVPLWENVLHLTYVENTGAAFGMMKDARWVFLILSSVAIVGIALYLFFGYARTTLATVAFSMIVSGGIGNMIDRIALGYVIDFIDFRLIHFAVFNGADSFVCVGAGLLVLSLILDILHEKKEKQDT